jgi:hypothetical protein
MPVDYNNGKIYKIVCNVTNLVYIGSTCKKSLVKRLEGHKATYKTYLNQKSNFMTSYKILENNNYDIILIEQYPCNSKQELHKKERFYIESIECVNKYIPNRNLKEYCIDKKEHIQEYQKDYYNDNIKQINEQKKEYYNKYKDLINIKCDCECGSNYIQRDRARHNRTLKHIKYCQTLI